MFYKKPIKIALLIIGLLPYIDWALMLIIYGNDVGVRSTFFIGLTIAAIVLVPILVIIYIIDIYRNKTVARNQKALWSVIIVFGSMLAFPFYWYLHVWRGPKKDESNIAK